MRLPEPSPWQYLAGLALLAISYLLFVGIGMSIEVQYDQGRPWVLMISATMAFAGVSLLWLSVRAIRR
jgi:hypothetical protein